MVFWNLSKVQRGSNAMSSLLELAKSNYSSDPVTKPLRYYEIYEQALREEGLSPKFILEIGVYEGESTKALARCFPSAHIVAVDLNLREIDFSDYENVHYLQCDQTDSAKLQSICKDHFPDGVDLVIDDASHIGHLSRLTFNSVFPHVRSGGLYIIEDWGTGYWDTWMDGGRFTDCIVSGSADKIARKIPSHNFGMVGFVKSLVDYTATDDIAKNHAVAHRLTSRLILSAGRFRSLRNIVERMPRVKLWLTGVHNVPANTQNAPKSLSHAELPRIKSLKFFPGVCIASKA
jgi:SAM-dependent methyltransferase